MVLDRDHGVSAHAIGSAASVDALARRWRAAASRPVGAEVEALRTGELLRQTLWDPVAAACGDTRRIFVVPDGELALLNFAALPAGSGGFLIERGPLLAVLGTERDLVPDPFEPKAGPCLLAIGAPDFDVAHGEPSIRRDQPGDDPGEVPAATGGRLLGRSFPQLPGTAAEAAHAAELWSGAGPGFAALQLTGDEATESAFTTLAPGFRVLHLATHGFFFDGDPNPTEGGGRGVGGLVPEAPMGAEPVRGGAVQVAGLVLAGANRQLEDAADDGILTAEEIATLDLSGVEWAVLSACESGVGEASTGEGVFGLRRAFRIAGARTVIMSLWPVDDEAAREWMTALYQARLGDRTSTAEAVRRASLEVLAARRARGDSVHPAHWAAFTASGDWR
jgi:CHAT domain-containing protein